MPTEPAPLAPLGVALRGLAIGSADLVPGVSGGTMALVLGVFSRLVAALGSFSRAATWRAVRQGRLGEAWRCVDGTFLLLLGVGILTAVATLPIALEWLLTHHRSALYAAFFGLIAASAPLVFARVRRAHGIAAAWALVGGVAAFVLVGATPGRLPEGVGYDVLAGAVGVSALLLPGVSGAFLLVLMGRYDAVLGALASRDVVALVPFALGMAVGLLAFSRLLSFALERRHDAIMGLLAGVLVGSLRKVWPWQEGEGVATVAATPPDVASALLALLLALLAGAAVLLLERSGRRAVPR